MFCCNGTTASHFILVGTDYGNDLQILGFWMFGTVICKLHAVLENFGKILSSLIITAMSFDRYVSVCHTQRKFLRSRRIAVSILIGYIANCFMVILKLIIPSHFFKETESLICSSIGSTFANRAHLLIKC